jgi:hypothetical protein
MLAKEMIEAFILAVTILWPDTALEAGRKNNE